ncbi:exodeoxyribonuclease III [Chitinophaga lutea]
MRIVTYNVNGLRSAMTKGFTEWLQTNPADVICLQEVKAHRDNVDFRQFETLGYEDYWFPAQKKGYSGVAILTRIKPDQVLYGNGHEQSDAEGRVIRADFGDITIVNAYFPSGTTGDIRQTYKYQWLDEFYAYLQELRQSRPNLVVAGDYNIAHEAIDIHNPVANKDSSGFLPEERAWMTKLLGNGFVDTFRHFNPGPHHYSWWSFRANARANNKGWRIDYINVSEPLLPRLSDARIWQDIKHSDHCPVFLQLN